MAKFERTIENQKLYPLLQQMEQGILDSSLSAHLESGSDFEDGDARCSVRVFERYSMVGGNRLSLTVTMFQQGFCQIIAYFTAAHYNNIHLD